MARRPQRFQSGRECFILTLYAYSPSSSYQLLWRFNPLGVERLFGKSKRILVLAADHRYFGVVAGLEKPRAVLTPLLPFVDVLMTDPGILRHEFGGKVKPPVLLRASGCTSTMNVPVTGYLQEPAKLAYQQRTGREFDKTYREFKAKTESGQATPEEFDEFRYLDSFLHEPDTIANEKLILGAEDVARLGAAGAAVSVYLRTKHQSSTLNNLATMSRHARKVGLAVLGVVAVGDALGYLEKDSDFLTRAGAILVAHGADLIKTYNCGAGFERVIEACGVPVIVAGGKAPKGVDETLDSLNLAYDSILKGAKGIDFGRRVWRHTHPVAMIQALRLVVHEGASPKQAYDAFQQLRESGK
jgi:3-hydroxy-5-phosphonooxypentane-2,4-dione thiolase